jgi:hypothetical protein
MLRAASKSSRSPLARQHPQLSDNAVQVSGEACFEDAGAQGRVVHEAGGEGQHQPSDSLRRGMVDVGIDDEIEILRYEL